MGELKQRGKIWWIRYYRNGRRHEESARTTKKTEAETLFKLREGDIAKGIPVTSQHARLRYDEGAADLKREYMTNGRRSLVGLTNVLDNHLTPYFGGRRMASITTADVRAYVAHRQEEGAKNATINRELAALKRMFTLAIESDRLMYRPKIAMLEELNVRSGFFERDQFEAVREKLPADLRSRVTFAYITGWRVQSEVAPLQWRQVDRKAGVVRLEPGTTKNQEGRMFYYSDIIELSDVLTAQWALHEQYRKDGRVVPWVFPRTIGRTKGQQTRAFRKSWLTACDAAGCPGRVPHDFRRTACATSCGLACPRRWR